MFDLLVTTATCACHPTHVRQLAWDEDPYNEFNRTENITFTQYINAHFIDIQKDVEEIGETIVDVKLPYDRVLPTHEEWFTATRNHMVRRDSHRNHLRVFGCPLLLCRSSSNMLRTLTLKLTRLRCNLFVSCISVTVGLF